MLSRVIRNFTSFGDRYAITLFSSAQQANQVKEVAEDIVYIKELISASPDFKVLLTDPTINKVKLATILDELGKKAQFCQTTQRMLQMMNNNKRLNYLSEVAKTFEAHVKSLDKRETVRVVSAETLNDEEKKQVEQALQEMDKSKKYELTFDVDSKLLGGLQLYFPAAFMELSLRSRLDKIRDEVSNIVV
jgi:F-type H+-transporting ATPase subunit delta